MRKIIFGFYMAIVLLPAFAEESNYIRFNKEHHWAKTSVERLVLIINNPVKYNPEEFVAALHEYSRRHGVFKKVRNSLEALVNAYIAKNPAYMDWSTEEIFIWTARSRGVPSLKNFIYEVPEETSVDGENVPEEDYVSVIFEYIQKKISSYQLLNAGLYDDGSIFTVYQVSNNINVTISIDKNGEKYIIGNVKSDDAMRKVLEYLTGFYSEPIPYLVNGSHKAVFHDSDDRYIYDNLTDYTGIITVYGSQMLVEEVIPQDKIIIQRQWCTPAFTEKCKAELGPGWGFIAPWDIEE